MSGVPVVKEDVVCHDGTNPTLNVNNDPPFDCDDKKPPVATPHKLKEEPAGLMETDFSSSNTKGHVYYYMVPEGPNIVRDALKAKDHPAPKESKDEDGVCKPKESSGEPLLNKLTGPQDVPPGSLGSTFMRDRVDQLDSIKVVGTSASDSVFRVTGSAGVELNAYGQTPEWVQKRLPKCEIGEPADWKKGDVRLVGLSVSDFSRVAKYLHIGEKVELGADAGGSVVVNIPNAIAKAIGVGGRVVEGQ